jgi:hypothetical protein
VEHETGTQGGSKSEVVFNSRRTLWVHVAIALDRSAQSQWPNPHNADRFQGFSTLPHPCAHQLAILVASWHTLSTLCHAHAVTFDMQCTGFESCAT